MHSPSVHVGSVGARSYMDRQLYISVGISSYARNSLHHQCKNCAEIIFLTHPKGIHDAVVRVTNIWNSIQMDQDVDL